MIILATSTLVYFEERLVEDLSRKLVASNIGVVSEELGTFLGTAKRNLQIAIAQLQMTQEDDDEILKRLFYRLSPFLSQHQNVRGIAITRVDTNAEYLIMKPERTSNREEADFLVRLYSPKDWGEDKLRFERWKDGEPLDGWFRKGKYDPKKCALKDEPKKTTAQFGA